MKFEAGIKELAAGKGAQYPMLGGVVGNLATSDPEHINDIGFFGQPVTTRPRTGRRLWMPAGLTSPSRPRAPAEAAKKFVAFVATPRARRAVEGLPAGWPLHDQGLQAAGRCPAAVKDLVAYVDAGKVTPALEYLSPVKGPALEQITVEVGSAATAVDGAALYDKDVKKQAQQLGLPGWESPLGRRSLGSSQGCGAQPSTLMR